MTRVSGSVRMVVRGVVGLALGLVVSSPGAAWALHGAAIQKVCLGPGNTSKARAGDVITCSIRITNTDTFNDTLRIDSIVDVINNLGGPTTTANLLSTPGGSTAPKSSSPISSPRGIPRTIR